MIFKKKTGSPMCTKTITIHKINDDFEHHKSVKHEDKDYHNDCTGEERDKERSRRE